MSENAKKSKVKTALKVAGYAVVTTAAAAVFGYAWYRYGAKSCMGVVK